jgi:gallate decarboxylase subunit D
MMGDSHWQTSADGIITTIVIDSKIINFSVYSQGEDLVVRCYGGESPHIGAVAIAIPRPSLADPKQRSASVSVYTVTGHKDDEIAVPLAKNLSASLGKTVVVVVGIHFEQADEKLIKEIEITVHGIATELISQAGKLFAVRLRDRDL